MPCIGRKSQELFDEKPQCLIEQLGDVLETATYIRVVLGDTRPIAWNIISSPVSRKTAHTAPRFLPMTSLDAFR